MERIETEFKDLIILKNPRYIDKRGGFQKLFNEEFFMQHELTSKFSEIYFSVNHRNVIRGMHFQLPPHDHEKLVYVSHGSILDVVVDLRKDSKTYGEHLAVELNDENGLYLYIPKGFAHGFASLKDDTIVNYAQTSCYAPTHDCGIMYDSCGIKWPFDNPIVSGRDLTFAKLSEFNSPF